MPFNRIFFFSLLFPLQIQAQHLSAEMPFIKHLFRQGDHLAVQRLLQDYPLAGADTVDFLAGLICFYSGEDEFAIELFNQVPSIAPYSDAAQLYQILILTEEGNYRKALKALHHSTLSDSLQPRKMELLYGLLLLTGKRNPSKWLKTNGYEFDIPVHNTVRASEKHTAIALVLSAMVPGAGKIYTGYEEEAVTAFISCASMAAVTAEWFLKTGLHHPGFILSAGIFTILYTGNIWGSAVSAARANRHANQNTNRVLPILRNVAAGVFPGR